MSSTLMQGLDIHKYLKIRFSNPIWLQSVLTVRTELFLPLQVNKIDKLIAFLTYRFSERDLIIICFQEWFSFQFLWSIASFIIKSWTLYLPYLSLSSHTKYLIEDWFCSSLFQVLLRITLKNKRHTTLA